MKRFKVLSLCISIILVLVFVWISFHAFEWGYLKNAFYLSMNSPFLLIILTICYTAAFLLRAVAWRWYLNGEITFSSAVIALFYSLFVNHVIPVKAGDIVRIGVVKKANPRLQTADAVQSVIVMRLLDIFSLFTISAAGMYWITGKFSVGIPYKWAAAGLCLFIFLILCLFHQKLSAFIKKQWRLITKRINLKSFPFLLFIILLSWGFEGAVVYIAAYILNHQIGALLSIWVNSMTVGGQIFQITPGGIATYETIMSAGLMMTGIPLKDSYTISILTHGFKFLYSYVVGGISLALVPITFTQIYQWFKQRGERKHP